MAERDFAPLHPGEVLLEEFLAPSNISQHQLALSMRVAQQKINDIVRGKRSITPDTALRLSIAWGLPPSFGLVCKWTTIWKKSEACSGKRFKPK